ncbi:unnamed protein product [Owenia fusiformis]|uniref:Uncharacterized protein n=1 Tax=Owenia fusiformis TaxID=6347 RepID=A0A8J1XGG3_OWEFU|nr:unnamed protein product [Owenia fusiformis]
MIIRVKMRIIVFTMLMLGVSAQDGGETKDEYTGPCNEVLTYSRRDCADSYDTLTEKGAYSGLSIQQYTWQCDHMYQWLENGANKTGNGVDISDAQREWLYEIMATITTTQSDTQRPGTRKEYRVATQAERDNFHAAINMLKGDTIAGPFGTTNKYDTLVSFHLGSVALGAHGGAAFLTWHRIYLLMFEIALQQKISSVMLLYWDSTLEQGLADPNWSSLWSEHFLGNGDGDVVTGPFANWDSTDGRKLWRAVNKCPNQLTTPADISAILSREFFGQIGCGSTACMLAEQIHGKAHSYVGGQMGDVNFSPNDPVFIMHHAFMDCIWEEFRQSSQSSIIATEYPTDFGSPAHAPNAFMQPFSSLGPGPIPNIFGLNPIITSLFYQCGPRPECPDCGNSSSLYCDTSDNRCKPFTMEGKDCDKDCAFVNAKIYCEVNDIYGQQYYGVNGVYLETYGVSYEGRRQEYYFGDYDAYYNIPQSPNPSEYRPCYNGYFPTKRPEAGGRQTYRPLAYTTDGRPCRTECFQGYRSGPGRVPIYGPCSEDIFIEDYAAGQGENGKRKAKRRGKGKGKGKGKGNVDQTYEIPYEVDLDGLYYTTGGDYAPPKPPTYPEYFQVTCPCDVQEYKYCPDYIPGVYKDDTQP